MQRNRNHKDQLRNLSESRIYHLYGTDVARLRNGGSPKSVVHAPIFEIVCTEDALYQFAIEVVCRRMPSRFVVHVCGVFSGLVNVGCRARRQKISEVCASCASPYLCVSAEPTWVQAIITLSSVTIACLRQNRPLYARCVRIRLMHFSLILLQAEFWSSMESALPVTVRAACVQAVHVVLHVQSVVSIAGEGEDSLGSFRVIYGLWATLSIASVIELRVGGAGIAAEASKRQV